MIRSRGHEPDRDAFVDSLVRTGFYWLQVVYSGNLRIGVEYLVYGNRVGRHHVEELADSDAPPDCQVVSNLTQKLDLAGRRRCVQAGTHVDLEDPKISLRPEINAFSRVVRDPSSGCSNRYRQHLVFRVVSNRVVVAESLRPTPAPHVDREPIEQFRSAQIADVEQRDLR